MLVDSKYDRYLHNWLIDFFVIFWQKNIFLIIGPLHCLFSGICFFLVAYLPYTTKKYLPYTKLSNMLPFFDFSDLPPVSQSNSSLKKHRSRSIFSPFFCCFRNYNDYHVEPPPANNKTLSLPPTPEENGSPPKVKLIFPLTSYLAQLQIAQCFQTRDQKMKKRELVNTRQESLFDSRDPVTSNICLVSLTESLLRFAFSCRELGPRRCVASPSSLHRFFQLLQTRWTQRLFTIRCLKIRARLPSCILRYLLTHAATRSRTRTHTQQQQRGAAHAPARHFFGAGLRNSSRRTRGNTCTHTLAHILQLL